MKHHLPALLTRSQPSSGSGTIWTADRDSRRLLVASTAFLTATAILGPVLELATINGINLSLFRLALIPYLGVLGWFWHENDIGVPNLPRALWFLIALGGYIILSLISVQSASRAGFELATLSTGILLAVVLTYSTTNRRVLERYLYVVFALVAVAEFVAFWEMFTDSHLHTSRLIAEKTLAPRYARIGSDAASAWYHNQNNLGFFLALATGPLTAYSLLAEDLDDRVLAGSGVTLAVVIVWANRSRIALIAILATVAIVTALTVARPGLRPIRGRTRDCARLIAGVFAVMVTALIVFAVVPNPFPEGAVSLWKRYQLGVAGSHLVVDSWGLGVGVGDVIPAVKALSIDTMESGALHNWLLYFLAAYGGIGTGLFIAAYVTIAYDLAVTAINGTDWLGVGLFGTLAVLPLNALGPSNAALTHSFWVVLGLAAAAAYRTRARPAKGRL